MRIDLNADLGEGIGDDAALLAIVSSASIATGAHAGGAQVLDEAVAAAVAAGVAVGAHPSYRDREGFGRRSRLAELRCDPSAAAQFESDLVDQIMLVAEAAERHGARLRHVKAHGALYNEAVVDVVAAEFVAGAVLRASERCGYALEVLTQAGGVLAEVAGRIGIVVRAEGFADRGYLPSGALVPRGEPGALLPDAAAMSAQALDLAAGRVRCSDGSWIGVGVDSVCVHGDTPGAVAAARAVRAALEVGGWEVRSERPTAGVRVAAFGDRGFLVEPVGRPGASAWVLAVADRCRTLWPDSVLVPGLGSVLVMRPVPAGTHSRLADELREALAELVGAVPARAAVAEHSIAVRYDGPDLADLAAALGVPAAELVARHSAARWTVAAVGFSPGFGYLTCDDPLFAAAPRRPDPRPRVPAGSVALAAGMCAVYPSATPGGWQLVGRTDAVMFDPMAASPALLRAGDRVRFRGVA